MTPDFEAPTRRSLRKVQEQLYYHDDAELIINIVSVRKKLDFTINKQRPPKRLKCDPITCQCSLTIWDTGSKGSEADPIVEKNVFGRLSVSMIEAYRPSVDVELEKPFMIQAADLKVPLEYNDELSLGLGESYIMELKLVPTRSDADWPPIPILGRSILLHYSSLLLTLLCPRGRHRSLPLLPPHHLPSHEITHRHPDRRTHDDPRNQDAKIQSQLVFGAK